MGFRELGFYLLIIMHLSSSVSSSPVRKNLPSGFMQKDKIEDKAIFASKIEGGSNHGAGSGSNHGAGRAPSNGENGNNGGSKSPNTPGGAAVIPVVVAGAANNNRHHSHHGAGNRNLNRIKLPTLLMITLVYPLMQLCL